MTRLLAGLLVLGPLPARALVTQDLSASTPAALAAALVGPGVSVSNVTFTGTTWSAGSFTGAAPVFGFDAGVVLSSGAVANAEGPNASDSIGMFNFLAGDANLTALAGATTADATVLEFDFVPSGNAISFQYVFGSDEYNEFVGQYNDAFGFFLDGVNLATIPGTGQPVSIATVNLTTNAPFFRNNEIAAGALWDTEMDGFTVTFTVSATLTPNVPHHLKIAIADAVDMDVDSFVFVKQGSLSVVGPDVRLTKQAPASIQPGQTLTYTLLASNAGGVTALNVAVWDTVPSGVAFLTATAGGAFDGTTVSWALGALPPGTTVPLAFSVQVLPSAGPLIGNTGALAWLGSGFTSTIFVNSLGVMTAVRRGVPEMHKTAAPSGVVCTGGTLTWRVSWRNTGTGTIDALVITDTLPPGVAVVAPSLGFWAQPDWLGAPRLSASGWAASSAGPWTPGEPPNGTASPLVLRWTVDRVAPGASGSLTFQAQVSGALPASGAIRNRASATLGWDSGVYATEETVDPTAAALQAALVMSPSLISTGQNFAVTLTVTNTGCAAVTALAPGTFTGAGLASAVLAAGPFPAPPVALAGGSSMTFTWTFTGVSPGNLLWQVPASATDVSTGTWVTSGLATGNVVTIQAAAALTGTVSVSPPSGCAGATYQVRLTVSNTGTAAATGVTPGTLVLTGAGGASVTAGPNPPGPVTVPGVGKVVFTWTLSGSTPGPVVHTTGAAGADANSGAATWTGSVTGTGAVVTAGALEASLSAPSVVSVGSWVTVTMTVTNTGGADVTAVTGEPLAFSAGMGTVVSAPNPVAAVLPAGTAHTFTWTFSVSGAGPLWFSATGCGQTCAGPVCAPASVGLTAAPPAILRAAVAVSPSVIVSGQAVTVTLTVTNTGGTAALNVLPTVRPSSGLAGAGGGPAPPSVPSLAPGAAVTFTWTFTTSGAGTVTFTGSASGADANSGYAVRSPAASAVLTIQSPAVLVIAAFTSSAAAVSSGGSVTMRLDVKNVGGAAAGVNPPSPIDPTNSGVLGPAGSVTPSGPVTIAAGQTATFTWAHVTLGCGSAAVTVTVTGTEVLTALSIGPLPGRSPGVAVYGAPATLTLAAAPAQAPATTGVTLTAVLTDACGIAVPWEALVFSASIGGGSAAPSVVLTDATGTARTTFALGLEPGVNVALVVLPSSALSATTAVLGTLNPLGLTDPGAGLSVNVISPGAGETALVRIRPRVFTDPVSARIFTSSGRLVRTLRNPVSLGAGQVAITWDGRTEEGERVARGVYLVHVGGGGISVTLKLLVK